MTAEQTCKAALAASQEAQARAKRENALRDAAPLLLDAMDYLAFAVRGAMPYLNAYPLEQATFAEALKWADEVAKKSQGDTP